MPASRRAFVLPVVLLALAATACGGETEVDENDASADVVSSDASTPAAGDHAAPDPLPAGVSGVLGMVVGRTTVYEAAGVLGGAEHRMDDGVEGGPGVCAAADEGGMPTVVRVFSDAEMASEAREITYLRVSRDAAGPDEQCGTLETPGSVRTPGGLALGVDSATVAGILGAAHAGGADLWHYEWQAEQPMDPGAPDYAAWDARRDECFEGRAPFHTVVASAEVNFGESGVVEGFTLSRVVTGC